MIDTIVKTHNMSGNCLVRNIFIPIKLFHRSRQKNWRGINAMGEVPQSSQGEVHLSQGTIKSRTLHVPTPFEVLMWFHVFGFAHMKR